MKDIFWSTFYTKPALVPKSKPLDYDQETDMIAKMCKELMELPDLEPSIRAIQYASDEFALESPLTPSTSMFQAVEAGAVGETFRNNPFRVCRCRGGSSACRMPRTSDWLIGPCGERVVEREPYSYIHVNLSRRVGTIEEYVKLIEPVFIRKRQLFRMVPGDSKLTLVMLALDREHEKEIRRILREKRFRVDKGIRIFEITKDLMGRDKRVSPPPSEAPSRHHNR